jgi:hypothetical protein
MGERVRVRGNKKFPLICADTLLINEIEYSVSGKVE